MVAKSLDGLSTGLWNGAVMATYIYLIEDNSNKACAHALPPMVPVMLLHLLNVHVRTLLLHRIPFWPASDPRLFPRDLRHAQMVGIAEGVFGIFCVASGLPAGWLADHMRRDRLLRIFGCLMLGALLTLLPRLSKSARLAHCQCLCIVIITVLSPS